MAKGILLVLLILPTTSCLGVGPSETCHMEFVHDLQGRHWVEVCNYKKDS